MATPEPYFHRSFDVSPLSVDMRTKKRITEETSEHQDTNVLLAEILAQQVAARRHLLILAVIAVLGVAVSAICAIVIAVQVTQANSSSSSRCTSIYSC
jgi:hypothetical protein